MSRASRHTTLKLMGGAGPAATLPFPLAAQIDAQAKAMLAKGARLQGIPGMQEPIKLWRMDGMLTKADGNTIFLINASGGKPEEPAPDSGEVIQLPPIQSPAGQAAVKAVKVGDQVITVWSQQTVIKATVIR